jgi:hypothetical protein
MTRDEIKGAIVSILAGIAAALAIVATVALAGCSAAEPTSEPTEHPIEAGRNATTVRELDAGAAEAQEWADATLSDSGQMYCLVGDVTAFVALDKTTNVQYLVLYHGGVPVAMTPRLAVDGSVMVMPQE